VELVMSKYIIEEVQNKDAWDAFVDASPQGSIFFKYGYLEHAVERFEIYWVKKGGYIKAGIGFVLGDDGKSCVLDDLVIHNGILFVDEPSRKATKARHERFEITECMIKWLTSRFDSVELALAPQFEDMRPFLWHNYHSENNAERFVLDLRYTSYIDVMSLKEFSNEEDTPLFRNLETLRQRNIREARKHGARVEFERKPDAFIAWYHELMVGQGDPQEKEKLSRMRRLIEYLLQSGQAEMIIGKNSKGKSLYSIVFCWDAKRAYYLFGAPSPGAKERYKGTITFWNGFIHLAQSIGLSEVDMEGVNSPQRGWFKLSFGGDLSSYYHIYKGAMSG